MTWPARALLNAALVVGAILYAANSVREAAAMAAGMVAVAVYFAHKDGSDGW